MPVTLVDWLPLPNLKVYTAGSVLLLSVAVYYALSATADPNWRGNGAAAQAGAPPADDAGAAPAPAPDLAPPLNSTRNLTGQLVEVITFMMQEPFCMWTVINMSYCALAVCAVGAARAALGPLRAAEARRARDKFWNFVFYKFIFVFGVVNVQRAEDVLLWAAWFSVLGALTLLSALCKDRAEYLSSSAAPPGWAHAKLAMLLGGILAVSGALLSVALHAGRAVGRDNVAFMAAECVLVLVSALHVCARAALRLAAADAAGAPAYYTQLGFDSVSLVVELAHVVHMVVYSNMLVSMASLVLLMQLRHLLHELQARLRRHRRYTERATRVTATCPMASKEEVEKNQDNCAICWEPMKEARKLPCSHLFHNSCLCQWVQQDASCPTCRRALARRAPAPAAAPDHLFHFNGSRYVSWLPSFSVEVTRVRAELPPAQLDAMARQVQQLFPQFPLSALAADLAASGSPDLTLDNILEGRLQPPPEPRAAVAAAATVRPTPDVTASEVETEAEAEPSEPAKESRADFSGSAAERELSLARRKRRLLAAARARYLARAPRS